MAIMARDFEFEKEICEALKLPKNTFAFDIHAHTDEIWTITIQCNLEKEQIRNLIPVMQKFKLIPIQKRELED